MLSYRNRFEGGAIGIIGVEGERMLDGRVLGEFDLGVGGVNGVIRRICMIFGCVLCLFRLFSIVRRL